MAAPDDAYDLGRFIDAQGGTYERALSELRSGKKVSHWMWFIFPQMRGLGSSSTSEYYGIRDADEGRAYLADSVLGERLREAAATVLANRGKSAPEIFGPVDALKLHSSMTLFAALEGDASLFQRVLDQYFAGAADRRTLELLSR